jgi:hypothetical protein
MIRFLVVVCGIVVLAVPNVDFPQTTGSPRPDPMKTTAERYVKLVLAMGQHDADYVDAYYGPAQWKKEAESRKSSLDEISTHAESLIRELRAAPAGGEDMDRLRHQYLERQLSALVARVRIVKGERMSFDDESKALYDAVAPTYPESHFQAILDKLEKRFPGSGPLVARYDAFRRQFIVPSDKLDTVFQAAIKGCRERTVKHVTLPPGESFTVEYVKGKSWSGYNWYQGNYKSLIQVNTDLPIYIDRAIDLACHEGYPGHHVYNALLEKHLVHDRGWPEFSVYPLFSPQSLIAEGTANFGIDVAFPGQERVQFETATLFPAAGLDPAKAGDYYQVLQLVEQLDYAGNEAARRYLNGQIDRTAAETWLERYALMPRERAAQRVRFMDQYRSYVINYNAGKDLVRKYIESQGGTGDKPAARWKAFEKLLSSPRLPSSLK